MATDIPIIVPSSGRAGQVLTNITGMVLFVADAEADTYRQHHLGTPIETHPDLPNLAAIRQAIYDRWPSVFMADDDLDRISRLYTEGNNRTNQLTPDEAHHLIQVTAHNARAASCALWGFSNHPNPKHYYPHKPISLTAYINASAIGLHPSDHLYFSSRTTAAESHWINLLNAATHRRVWADQRFCFAQAPGSTFHRPGGQTARRTAASERSDTLFLRRMFGQAVHLKRHRGDAALAHPWQRAIANPL